MNTLNKIHYCVTISLINNDQDNDYIGMRDGVIRYVTDGVNLSGYHYEDGTPVSEYFFSDIVSKDGFSNMGSKIDITAGGDYGFLQSFNLSLSNHTISGRPYHKELYDEDTYVVGGDVKVYAILDGVLYNRWSGSVSGITFDDKKFIWNCEDSHSSKNNTIKDTPFGLIKQLTVVEVDQTDTKPSFTVEPCRVKPDASESDLIPTSINYLYPKMSGDDTIGSTNYGFAKMKPESTGITPHQYYSQTTQTDSDYYQLWFFNDKNVNIDNFKYVSVSIGGEAEGNKYPIITSDSYMTHENVELTRVLIKGECPLVETLNEYGFFEHLVRSNDDDICNFDGTLLRFYKTGDKLLDGVNADNIDKLVDKDGNEISKDLIIEQDGEYYLPYNITTYKIQQFNNNDIMIKYSDTENFHNISVDDFHDTYTGMINPNRSNKISDLMIKNTIDFEFANYDKVYLGVDVKKEEKYRQYSGLIGSDTFTFDDFHDIGHNDMWGRFVLGENKGQVHRWLPDGNVSVSMEYNHRYDLQRTMSNGLNFVVGNLLYDSDHYGLIIKQGTYDEMFVPFGQSVDVTWNGSNSHINIGQTGSYNLPQGINYNPDLARINTNNTFPIFYRRVAHGHGLSGDLYTEFEYFYADLEDTDSTVTTIVDIKDVLTDNDRFFLKVSGELYVERTVVDEGLLIYKYHYDYAPHARNYFIDREDILDVPAYINFYAVGQNTSTSSEIFAKYIDDNSNSVGTETIGKVLSRLSGDTNVIDIRPTYYVGRYLKEQRNKFDVVTELCRQSFIGGYTNRAGDTVFKRLLERTGSVTHDYSDIIDKSIRNFKHTPISKVYNEFEVKYNYMDNKPENTLEIHNVDKDEFPTNPFVAGGDIYKPSQSWNNPNNYRFDAVDDCVQTQIYFLESVYNNAGYDFEVGDTIVMDMLSTDTSEHNGLSGRFDGTITNVDVGYDGMMDAQAVWLTLSANTGTDLTIINPSPSLTFPANITPSNTTITSSSFGGSTTLLEWQEYVVGIDNYNEAKTLWDKCHEAYLVTGVIQKAPSNRTDLKWAIDRNWFYDTDIYDSTVEYAYDYFNKLIDWSTYQKFQVNYSLPITADNLKLELLQDIEFSDPIITPDVGEIGRGWITKYEVDPRRDIINIQLLFEPEFYKFSMMPPSLGYPICGDIIENENNTDSVIENDTNTDSIIEGVC